MHMGYKELGDLGHLQTGGALSVWLESELACGALCAVDH